MQAEVWRILIRRANMPDMRMPTRTRAKLRSFPLASIALTLVGLLALALVAETIAAIQSQRDATMQLLKSYAELAADELVRRAPSAIGYAGYFRAQQLLARARKDGSFEVGRWREFIPHDADPAAHKALGLIKNVFVLEPDALETDAPEDSEMRATLLTLSPPEGDANGPFRVSTLRPNQDSIILVDWALDSGQRMGFEVDRSALGAFLSDAIASAPLLPPSVAASDFNPPELFVRVIDPFGAVLYVRGEEPDKALRASRPFDDHYGGLFTSYAVETGITSGMVRVDRVRAVPNLSIATLEALAGLALLLACVAAYQLHAERRLVALRAEFIARVSHELRTPLTQIRIYAESMILNRIARTEDQRHAMIVIERESRRLGNMVENILRFSGRERAKGDATDAEACCDVPEVARSALESLIVPEGAPKPVIIPPRPELPLARINHSAMYQVLVNLLDNALKYGGADTPARLHFEQRNGWLRILLDDSGPGIPGKDRERVWQPYFRLNRDRSSAAQGAGIGMAVVKDLAESVGGRVRIDDSPCGGVRVIVELRCREV